jgi:hypothetical protein
MNKKMYTYSLNLPFYYIDTQSFPLSSRETEMTSLPALVSSPSLKEGI